MLAVILLRSTIHDLSLEKVRERLKKIRRWENLWVKKLPEGEIAILEKFHEVLPESIFLLQPKWLQLVAL